MKELERIKIGKKKENRLEKKRNSAAGRGGASEKSDQDCKSTTLTSANIVNAWKVIANKNKCQFYSLCVYT